MKEKNENKDGRLTAEEKRKRIQELAEKANQNESFQLPLNLEFEEDSGAFDTSILIDTQNPDQSYKVYYDLNGITTAT